MEGGERDRHEMEVVILFLIFRLFAINNETFRGFPELSRLNLAGNRFTTTFRTEYFAGNPYLNDIWLGDNPWRCECFGHGLQEFYQYLTVPPARVSDQLYLHARI